MVRSHAAAGAAITGNGLPPCCRPGHQSRHAAPSRRIAGTPTHDYAETREAAMMAFAKSWRRE
jgi:hypothetical protein